MSNKIIYTNEQMSADLQEIIRQIMLSDFRPDAIVGIARGGLVPATMLSHYFQKSLMVINYSLRDNKVSHISEINDLTQVLNKGQKVLIVDDICDSGVTLRKVVDEATEGFNGSADEFKELCKSTVLWNNVSQDVFDPDYTGREISRAEDDSWVIFPYEEWWKL